MGTSENSFEYRDCIDEYFDGHYIGESVFTVILTDDRGKEWRIDRIEKRTLICP
ncbi:MAG: hypothetical protein Q4F84_07660 [Fibrobacter sp.]|nr:hypothetical protein [Fibrobacter sp.]